MTNPHLIELETRLAYQDETLRVLSEEVARQQRLIEHLEQRWQEVSERLSSLAQALAPALTTDEPPPHY